jgi:hypothetical protein
LKKKKNKNLKGFEPLKVAAVSLQQLFRKKEKERKRKEGSEPLKCCFLPSVIPKKKTRGFLPSVFN